MTFAFLFPNLISSGQIRLDAGVSSLAALLNGGGEMTGLILLLAMSIVIPVALWWNVYQTLLVWLRARSGSDSRRR